MTAGATRDVLWGYLFDSIGWRSCLASHDGSITEPFPDAKSVFSRQRRSGSVLVFFSMATALFLCVGGGSGSSGSSGSMNWMNFTNGDDD